MKDTPIHNPDDVTPPPGYRLLHVGEVMSSGYLFWDTYTGRWEPGSLGRGHRVGVEFNGDISVCVAEEEQSI